MLKIKLLHQEFLHTLLLDREQNNLSATPEQAIEWVRENAKKGADGIKFFGAAPQIMDAAIRENKKLGLRSAVIMHR